MLLVSGVYYNLYNVLQDEKGAAVNATAPIVDQALGIFLFQIIVCV